MELGTASWAAAKAQYAHYVSGHGKTHYTESCILKRNSDKIENCDIILPLP